MSCCLILVEVTEDFAMPTVGFTTVLDTIGLGLGTLGLEDTVCVSVLVGTGSCVLLTLSERATIGLRYSLKFHRHRSKINSISVYDPSSG